jgi:DNA primase
MGKIPNYIVTEIKEKAQLLEVAAEFLPLSGSGATRTAQCPKCGAKKKFSVTPAKDIYKCFSCGIGGKGAVAFLMKVQEKTYIQALEWLAARYNIFIDQEEEYKPKKRAPKAADVAPLEPIPLTAQRRETRKTSPVKSFRDTQLAASGLDDEDQKIEIVTDENTKHIIDRYIPATLNERYEVVPGDDMAMRYVTLDCKLVTYIPKEGKKERDFFRMRWQNPSVHLDKEGSPMKYQSPAGSGAKLWFPSKLISLYNSGKVFDTLFFTEGEKKADKAMKHGMNSIGLMGIHNLAFNNRLPHEVEMLVKRGTKNVVFVVDADFRDLGKNRDKSASARPYSFMKAAYNFQQYFFALHNDGIHLNIYFAYVRKNEHNEKGIDDLLAGSMAGKEDQVVKSVLATMNMKAGEGQYLDVHNVTDWSYQKFQQFFHLQNVQEFGNFYKSELSKEKVFRFGRELWRFNPDNDEVELAQPIAESEKFWDVRKIKRAGGSEEEIFRFRWTRVYSFLMKRGFGIYKSPEGNRMYVQTDRNIVTQVDRGDIQSYIMNFVELLNNEDLSDMLYANGARYFSDMSLQNLKPIDPRFHTPQRGVQYMFFEKCYWKITAEGIKEEPLSDLNGLVWKTQISNQSVGKIGGLVDVRYVPDPIQVKEMEELKQRGELPADFVYDYALGNFYIENPTEAAKRCHFMNFIMNTSNFFPEKTQAGEALTDVEQQEVFRHFLQKCTAFGYLLHTFHDSRVTKAVIAMDAKLSEVGASQGRSGKSLLGIALQRLLETVYIPGKAKDITEDRFLLEEVKPGITKILWIDDVRMNFDFEFFFPFITGGAKYETKGLRRTTLSRENTPKLYICTNHAINQAGGSYASRMVNLAFSHWYHDDGHGNAHTPVDDFGVTFFDEWDADQWNLFYNFAAFCLQQYFRYGIVPAPNDRLELRRLRQFMGDVFLDFCDQFFANPTNMNNRIPRDEFNNAFYDKLPDQRRFNSVRMVKQKLIAYCTYRNLRFNPGTKDPRTNRPDGGDYKAGGIEYFLVADENYLSTNAANTMSNQNPSNLFT